jgi:hypothetical protein
VLAVVKHLILLPTCPIFIQDLEDRCLFLTSSTSFVELSLQGHRMWKRQPYGVQLIYILKYAD